MEMEYKKKESNEREHQDEYVSLIFFAAAGTVLTMACLQRIAILFFVDQWRIRVFLVLNLVLLAILFSSIRSASREEKQETNDNIEEKKVEKKKRRKQCGRSPKLEAAKDECHKSLQENSQSWTDFATEMNSTANFQRNQQEHLKGEKELPKLSKEELNERVEAFIAMFRQQLVSDARKSPKSSSF